MNFAKFIILSGQNMQSQDEIKTSILFNLEHVVSIKPIRFVFGENVEEGYWVRLTNGKKYRALEIPDDVKSFLTA